MRFTRLRDIADALAAGWSSRVGHAALAGWCVLLLTVSSSGVGHAAEQVEVLEGTAITASRCEPDPGAACWSAAQRLQRFAAEPEARLAPIQADVRLAWDDSGLLVRVGALPPGRTVELVVQRGTGVAETTAQVARFGEGVHPFPLQPEPRASQLRGVLVSVVQQAGAESAAPVSGRWVWTPAGDGDLTRPARLLLARKVHEVAEVQADLSDGRLTLRAEDVAGHAPWIELTWLRSQVQSWAKGVPDPWQATGESVLDVEAPPERGWYQLEATWRDSDARPVAQRRGLVWLPGGTPPPQWSAHGIHPAPADVVPSAAGEFVLGPTTRIVLSEPGWQAGANLLADELHRLSGVRLEVVLARRARPGDIWIGSAARRPPRRLLAPDVDRDVLARVDAPQSFALAVSERGAVVRAADRLSATWGMLALADGLGADARLAAFTAADRPGTPHRMLYHPLESMARGGIELPIYTEFIEKIVTRGRYDQVVFLLTMGMVWQSHPQLASRNALTPEQVLEIVTTAHELGIEVIPGSNSPAHVQWLVKAHRDLAEDGKGNQICLRHPGSTAILDDLYTELLDLFTLDGQAPRWFHIGHDEVHWRTDDAHEEVRCPRCQGVPRHVLLAQSIASRHAFLQARGVKPILWTDMLLEDWNGGKNGMHRTLELLTPDVRGDALYLGWSQLGDTVGTAAALGLDSGRVHTGYTEWKREGLVGDLERAEGHLTTEGLAVFAAQPWSLFGYRSGTRMLRKSWPAVLLAGTTGWRPELEVVPAMALAGASDGLAAYAPGFRHPGPGVAESAALELSGEAPSASVPVVLPERLEVEGVTFDVGAPVAARLEQPVTAALPEVAGLSLLLTAVVDLEAEQRLGAAHTRADDLQGTPIAVLTLTREDGNTQQIPLFYGIDVFRPDGDARAALLWRAAGVARVPSVTGAASHSAAGDMHLTRWDWLADPGADDSPLRGFELAVVEPGVELRVYGASAWMR